LCNCERGVRPGSDYCLSAVARTDQRDTSVRRLGIVAEAPNGSLTGKDTDRDEEQFAGAGALGSESLTR
jgi:hypothetical protein